MDWELELRNEMMETQQAVMDEAAANHAAYRKVWWIGHFKYIDSENTCPTWYVENVSSSLISSRSSLDAGNPN